LSPYLSFEPRITLRINDPKGNRKFPFLHSFSYKKDKKQKRSRPNKRRRHKYNNLRLTYSSDAINKLMLNKETTTVPSYNIKRSLRWYSLFNKYLVNGVYPLPYIDKFGYVSRVLIGYWNTDFRSILTSMISTIFNRLIRRFQMLRNNKFCFDHWREMVACATIYAMNQNRHTLNRGTYLLKTGRFRDLKFFLSNCIQRFDNNTRFVCCQALKQADWLSSRSHILCNRKSSNNGKRVKYPYIDLSKFECLTSNQDFPMKAVSDAFVEKYQLIIDKNIIGIKDSYDEFVLD